MTGSGIPLKTVYGPEDIAAMDPGRDLGDPGSPPFTRGPYANMYREKLWTMRQFAGFGSAEDSNARFKFLLDQGQTALSVAFDLPTQLGYDSDHPLAISEVGRVGVAIDTVDDMADLFAGIPLDQTSVNLTINATAPIILAFYLVTAERQGVALDSLSGTLQNDILKEFLARKAFIFPPAPSMRLVTDIVEWASVHLSRFNPISITGYHAREAGCNAVQELGLTMASAVAYCEALQERGLAMDAFAPRLSFHFATTLDLFEEVAKLRAARRMWHRIATSRFEARDPRSARLRFFSGNSGTTLTAAQPLNNVVRSTVQCLGAVLGGAQSIHVMGYDEPFQIPSEEAVTLALRTQQIVAYESGLADVVDPLAGSYFVESLTSEIEERAGEVLAEVEQLGGAVAALDKGVPQRWIAEEAYRQERAVAVGTSVKVGVNRYVDEAPAGGSVHAFTFPAEVADRQVARTVAVRKSREAAGAAAAIGALRQMVREGANVMPSLIDAARAGATLGEMSAVFRDEFGEFVEPSPW